MTGVLDHRPTAANSKNSASTATSILKSGPPTEMSARFQIFWREYAPGLSGTPPSSSA